MSSKNRYFELNPIQGTFIKFRNETDYPHKPRQIINLKDIVDISIISDGWFIKKGCSYFQIIEAKGDKNYFFLKNERLIIFWVNELKSSKSFHHWLKNISEIGYKCQTKL